MPVSEISNELLLLFDAVLSQHAGKAEGRRLEELLDRDSEVREQFALVSQLDVNLRHTFCTGALAPGQKPLAGQPLTPHVRGASRWSAAHHFWLLPVGLAAAALVVISFLPALFNHEQAALVPEGNTADSKVAEAVGLNKPPAPVATLASNEEAQWEGLQLVVGQALHEGETISLQRGKARISVGFGAEIVAEGPCELTFLARDKVRLDSGKVAVDVAEWAKGYTVVTDAMEVVDLGTTFTVYASQDASAQTNVLKGLVRVHHLKRSNGEKGGVLVSAGEGFSIDGLGHRKTLQQVSGDSLSRFDFGDLAPYRPVELHNTGVGLGVGDEDAHWQITAGPDGDFDGPTHAVVCKAHQRWLPNEIGTSQWVSTVNWGFATASSVYTFQTMFDLTGYDLTTTQLFGRFLADNGIQEIRVNGKPVDVKAWVDNIDHIIFDHDRFRFVNVTNELVQGTNEIEIDVFNGIYQEWNASEPNPMALRVEWYAFGRTLEPIH